MTLPAGVVPQTDKIPGIGIGLIAFTTDSEFGVEWQRAPDDGSGDPDVGSAEIIANLPPSARFFLDYRESQDDTWHYRWRHFRDGYTEGDWTPWLSARARQIPNTIPEAPKTPLLDANIYLDPTTNEVLLEINAEPWVRSVLWEVDTSGSWPDLDDGGASCTALDSNGDASIPTGTILAADETARVELRFYDQAACAGNAVGTLRLALPLALTPPAPQMTIIQSQSGAIGTLTITVWDPALMSTALTFAEKTDAGNYGGFSASWTTSSGTPGVDTTLSRTRNISLIGKHNVAIMVALDYTENGIAKSDIRPISFDSDLIAEITGLGVSYDADGTVNVHPIGDEDTANIYVTVGINTTPADPTSGSFDGAIAGRSGTASTSKVSQVGDLVVVKAVGLDSSAVLGPVFTKSFRRGDSATHPFSTAMNRGQSGANATFSFTIQDPSLSITAIQKAEKTGGGDFGSFATWSGGSGTPGTDRTLIRSASIAFASKHNVALKARITYTDTNGTSRTWEEIWNADSDFVAEITGIEISFDTDDSVIISAQGDEDTSNMYVTAGTSVPSDPTIVTNDGTISGNTGSVDTGVTVDPGETAYVKVVGANASAVLGPVRSAQRFREELPPTVEQVQADFHDTGTNLEIDSRWVKGGATNSTDHDLTIQYFIDDALVLQETGVSVDASQPYEKTITGAGGLPGSPLGWCKFLLELKSNNRPLDTKDSRRLAVTT
jgi:hypothetical protein